MIHKKNGPCFSIFMAEWGEEMISKNCIGILILDKNYSLPFIIIKAQCPEGKMWSDMGLIDLAELLNSIIESYHVDSTRSYAIGYSMGGNGVLVLAYYAPDIFAALTPISGMSNIWYLQN